jgi:sirohydrochlorin cobaltochelatase
MAMNLDTGSLAALEERVRTILPDLYQDCYEDVQPVSMGSASLKYAKDGKVAWDEMWDSFCDLAMAGGPPHKGTLLTPGTPEQVAADPVRYQAVVKEISRGIDLVADLKTKSSEFPGWLRVEADDALMAEWLVRAIVMENVSAHWKGKFIFLPAGPSYRMEKEIKNVVTVIAKTSHYWIDHMWLSQQRKIAALFAALAAESPLLAPSFPNLDGQLGFDPQDSGLVSDILGQTGLEAARVLHSWLGLECHSVGNAIWMMRGMVASNVLARREGTVLFVPLNGAADPGGKRVLRTVTEIHHLARVAGIV